MKQVKIFFTIVFIINTFYTFSQNGYSLSLGTSIPDNISNKYIKLGFNFNYGISLKLSKYLSLSPDISLSFNNKNKNYKFGFEDEPKFQNNPMAIQAYEFHVSRSNYYSITELYLFNTALGLSLKYTMIPLRVFSPYAFIGLSGNYSMFKNPVDSFEFDDDGNLTMTNGGNPNLQQKFNLAYLTGLGFSYKFRENKSIFIESSYKLHPLLKFGRNMEAIGLFSVNFGFSAVFAKKDKINGTEDIE
jgi:hypothetical protein